MAWLVVILDATNTGAESGDLYMALAVREEQGRTFPFRSTGSREEIDLAGAYGVEAPFAALDGGASNRLLATFQVPSRVTAAGRRGRCRSPSDLPSLLAPRISST